MEPFGNVELTQSPSKAHWAQMRQLIDAENWESTDHSVMDMLPYFSATKSVVVVDGEKVLGFLIWSDSVEMKISWIAYYYIIEELRGKGLGRQLCKKMIDSIPPERTWALRTHDDMAEKYRHEGFTVSGKKISKLDIKAAKLKEGVEKVISKDTTSSVRLFSELSDEEQMKLYAYDMKVTGQDRSKMLLEFFKHKEVIGAIAFHNDSIIGYGAIVPTGPSERTKIKMAPLYADSFETTIEIIKLLLADVDPDRQIILYTLENSIGSKDFTAFLLAQNACCEFTVQTLLTAGAAFPLDFNCTFAIHCHNCHIDG